MTTTSTGPEPTIRSIPTPDDRRERGRPWLLRLAGLCAAVPAASLAVRAVTPSPLSSALVAVGLSTVLATGITAVRHND